MIDRLFLFINKHGFLVFVALCVLEVVLIPVQIGIVVAGTQGVHVGLVAGWVVWCTEVFSLWWLLKWS